MSKRPKTANAVMSRLRRPAGRLRDMPIWTKLGLIMLVPTLATIIVGTQGLLDHIEDASNAEQARTLAILSQASGELSDHIQNERSAAVWLMSSGKSPANRNLALKQYNAEHPLVDAAKRPYEQQKAALNTVPEKTRILLLRLERNLEDLPSLRSQVTKGNIEKDTATKNYQNLVNDLLNVRDTSAQLALNPELSDHMRAAAAVARAKENISQQRSVGHEVLGQAQFTLPLRRSFLLTETGYEQADLTLKSVGTDAEIALFEQLVAGPDKRAATNYSGYFVSRTNENIGDIRFNAEQWDAAMAGYSKLFRSVETRLDDSIVSDATDLRGSVQRSVFLETSILLGMLLLAILFAWLVARSMARSLRELRQGALSVAQFGLPHAVGRLRDPSLSSSLTPAQLADQIAEPLPVRSRDEFGQVTEAFNAVHLEAVRTAAEQAALRSSVSTMFVNLARRSQILVDRLIGHLDRLERGEEDPDRLAELFQLDHLATRMRRNDENLLVLAGADSTRIQREPAALIDVLRAAQSEVEHYTRIEFGNVERDIEVSAHAVNDMVHLVAELFDNATAFSPPNSHVMVEARRVGERTTLYVEDRGIGISPDQLRELNERLANPPMVDVAVSRMMGLVVVARLANRHGVKVELRPAGTERGTVAEVGLPSAVLVPRAMAGRLQPGGATSFDSGPEQQSTPRPSFAAPLALESGPVSSSRGSAYPTGRPFDPNPPTLAGGMLGATGGGGRSVPAWSDLTGAPGGSNGSNGSNGFHGPRSNEVLPPNPFGGGDESLPRRRNGEPFPGDDGQNRPDTQSPQGFGGSPGFGGSSGFGGSNGQGSNGQGSNGQGFGGQGSNGQGFGGQNANGQGSNGQGFGGQSFGGQGFGGPQNTPGQGAQSGANIPRQLPSNPDNFGRNTFVPPVSAPPVPPVSAPPVASGPPSAPSAPHPSLVSPSGSYPVVPASAPPASAPPAWPPVANDRDTGSTPTVPESLAAALDMTAEIPRVRDRFGTGAQPQVSRPGSQVEQADVAPSRSGRPADEQRSADHAAAAHEAATAQAAAAQATASAQIAAAQAAARQRASGDNPSRFADETMELPIFRELESAWFQTARPGEPANGAAKNGATTNGAVTDTATEAPESAPEADAAEDRSATAPVSSQRYSTAEPTRSTGVPQQASSPESAPDRMSEFSGAAGPGDALPSRTPAAATASTSNGSSGSSWRTAADDGWQAARAAAETPVDTTTTAGLPRRTPMAQLVPGGVDRAGASVQRRTPEAVRGLLSAYHRGVQRGRTKDHPTNPEETPGGQQSSQAGKEHEG